MRHVGTCNIKQHKTHSTWDRLVHRFPWVIKSDLNYNKKLLNPASDLCCKQSWKTATYFSECWKKKKSYVHNYINLQTTEQSLWKKETVDIAKKKKIKKWALTIAGNTQRVTKGEWTSERERGGIWKSKNKTECKGKGKDRQTVKPRETEIYPGVYTSLHELLMQGMPTHVGLSIMRENIIEHDYTRTNEHTNPECLHTWYL